MTCIHFLNVKDGDCTIIQHDSGRCTMIDVSNAREHYFHKSLLSINNNISSKPHIIKDSNGNFNMKAYPTNPIQYMNKINEKEIFRYIQTHPDMDHMDGIQDIFTVLKPINFWDTDNDKIMDEKDFGQYREDDWKCYQSIRNSTTCPTTLKLYSNDKNKYFNLDENDQPDGDGLHIIAPSKEIIEEIKSQKSPNYNDCSYVILLKSHGRKVLFGGDSANLTWNYILNKKELISEISNVDILLAPHHGRKTGGDNNNDYLNILNPKLTLFGNANSDYLDYNTWNNRDLEHITNNQAGNIIVEILENSAINVYVENQEFASAKRKDNGWGTSDRQRFGAFFLWSYKVINS